MNWYKYSKLETFEDRNKLNKRIKFLKEAVSKLNYLKKYVFQNAPHAKRVMMEMAENKIMSSFPVFKNLMKDCSSTALDNYEKFAEGCEIIIEKLVDKIKELEKERKEFSNNFNQERIKNDRKDKSDS